MESFRGGNEEPQFPVFSDHSRKKEDERIPALGRNSSAMVNSDMDTLKV